MKRYKRTGRQPRESSSKEKKISTKMVLSIGIALIMASSIVGFLTLGNSSGTSSYGTVEYNNHTLQGSADGWSIDIGGTTRTFQSLPSDVEKIAYPSDIPNWIRQAQVITMTSSPDDNLSIAIGGAEYELFTQFSEQQKIITYAFTKNNTFEKPIITCANATLYQPVIYFQSGNDTAISREGYCIIAMSNNNLNMQRLLDRIFYTHYQIIADDVVVNDTLSFREATPAPQEPNQQSTH